MTMQSVLIVFIICASIVFIVAAILNRYCKHEWKEIKQEKVNVYGNDDKSMPVRREITYIYECVKCGEHKLQTLSY